MADESGLAAALGRVALADAEVDEWLVQLLIVLLRPHSADKARLLIADRSAAQKAAVTAKLLDLQYACSDVGAQHRPVVEIFRDWSRLKSERDRVLHAFYRDSDTVGGGAVVERYRSRNPGTQKTSLTEIGRVADGLFEIAREISAVLRQIEHLQAAETGHDNQVVGLLEDCRELLALARIQQQGLLEAAAGEFVGVVKCGCASWAWAGGKL